HKRTRRLFATATRNLLRLRQARAFRPCTYCLLQRFRLRHIRHRISIFGLAAEAADPPILAQRLGPFPATISSAWELSYACKTPVAQHSAPDLYRATQPFAVGSPFPHVLGLHCCGNGNFPARIWVGSLRRRSFKSGRLSSISIWVPRGHFSQH